MRNIDKDRGTGRTTKQMQAAASGALFVSYNAQCARTHDYTLAERLERTDLSIVAPEHLESLRGLQFPEIVVDHAAALSNDQQDALLSLRIGQKRTRYSRCE